MPIVATMLVGDSREQGAHPRTHDHGARWCIDEDYLSAQGYLGHAKLVSDMASTVAIVTGGLRADPAASSSMPASACASGPEGIPWIDRSVEDDPAPVKDIWC